MLGLVPTELHRYSLHDVVRGLMAARKSDLENVRIGLPALGDGIPLLSARAAIVVSIKALGIAPGSAIGVPLYCCPVVFKAIKMAGCRPRFLDIDPATFCISTEDLRAKCHDLEAVVPVHMFGNMCEMDSVREAMRGKPIIEDCAQALGSHWRGRPAGSMGTVAVFSFRLGKYLSAGEGAAIYASEPDLAGTIGHAVAHIEGHPRREEITHVMSTYLKSKLRSKPLWGLAGSSIWRIYNQRTDFIDKSPIVIKKIFRSDSAIARRRMTHLDLMIKAQRENADYYINYLRADPSMLCLEKPESFYNRYMFPVVLGSTEQRVLMHDALHRQGIGSSTPYEEVIEGAAKNYGYERDCTVAERLLKRTLVIPCHYKLTRKEREYIVRSFNAALETMVLRESRGLS